MHGRNISQLRVQVDDFELDVNPNNILLLNIEGAVHKVKLGGLDNGTYFKTVGVCLTNLLTSSILRRRWK